ncbi:MAG: hypothetical protein RBR86_09120 [Pseudobdellovibrionaceae bacterium]|nr:hypothetical protein [Pseudobdellovibrionaceae bacterium]
MQIGKKRFKIGAVLATAAGAAIGYIGGDIVGADPIRVKASDEFKCVAGGEEYGGQQDDLIFIYQPKSSKKFLMFATAPTGRLKSADVRAPDLKGDFAAYVDYTRPSLSGASPLGFISIDKSKGKCELTIAMTEDMEPYAATSYRLKGVLAFDK